MSDATSPETRSMAEKVVPAALPDFPDYNRISTCPFCGADVRSLNVDRHRLFHVVNDLHGPDCAIAQTDMFLDPRPRHSRPPCSCGLDIVKMQSMR